MQDSCQVERDAATPVAAGRVSRPIRNGPPAQKPHQQYLACVSRATDRFHQHGRQIQVEGI